MTRRPLHRLVRGLIVPGWWQPVSWLVALAVGVGIGLWLGVAHEVRLFPLP